MRQPGTERMSKMEINRKQAVGLLEELGNANASKWTDKKISEKFVDFPNLETPEFETTESKDLFDQIVKAVNESEDVVVVYEAVPAKEKKMKKNKEKSKKDKKVKAAKEKAETKKDKKSKKTDPKERGPKKGGVLDAIFKCLTSKPISKEAILAKLTEKFPDRQEEQMKATINAQLPSRLAASRGVTIEKNEKGYFIKS